MMGQKGGAGEEEDVVSANTLGLTNAADMNC